MTASTLDMDKLRKVRAHEKGGRSPLMHVPAWLPSFGGVLPRTGLVEGLFFPAQHKNANPCNCKGDDGDEELKECHSFTSLRILPRM